MDLHDLLKAAPDGQIKKKAGGAKSRPAMVELIKDLIINQNVRRGSELLRRVTEAGFMSPQTGKPYDSTMGCVWIKKYDPNYTYKGRRRQPPKVIDVKSDRFTADPKQPAAAPVPIPSQVAIIVCPLNQVQRLLGEICKTT